MIGGITAEKIDEFAERCRDLPALTNDPLMKDNLNFG
jgi:hypothetical protein